MPREIVKSYFEREIVFYSTLKSLIVKEKLEDMPVEERERKRQKYVQSLAIKLNHIDYDGEDEGSG